MGVSITKAGKRRSLLTIETIAPYNAGDYVCQGENIVGSAYYKAKLVVNGDWHYQNFKRFLFICSLLIKWNHLFHVSIILPCCIYISLFYSTTSF